MDPIEIFLHIDQYLGILATDYGAWLYLILFLVIFCETGLVVTPFLPGDSLLFVAGALAAKGGALEIHSLALLLMFAAVAGDGVNYLIGRKLGAKLIARPDSCWFRHEYLERTHAFYEKHGGKTIILARFFPFIRTYAPFVAGLGDMGYRRFISFNLIGGVAWVGLFLYGGYWFGEVPLVKQNLSKFILLLLLIPAIPAGLEFLRQWRSKAA